MIKPRHHGQNNAHCKIDDLLDESLVTGKHNARDFESRLKKRFCIHFGERQMGEISRAEISKWIQELPHTKRGRRNFHTS